MFNDENATHGHAYLASDIFTSLEDKKDGSWDLLICEIEGLVKNEIHPIFIEVKSTFEDNEKLVGEIVAKIKKTEELAKNNVQDLILSQISAVDPKKFTMRWDKAEYVVFIPGRLSMGIVDYIASNSKKWKNKTGLVIWSYDKGDTERDVIQIPYNHRNDIKTCRNIDNAKCNLCLCNHYSSKMASFFRHVDKQELEKPRIMPSKHKYVDPVVNIISILHVGKLFRSNEKNLTLNDIKERVKRFFIDYSIELDKQEIEFLIYLMNRGKIILKTKGDPMGAYHLNKDIADALEDEKLLTEEIVKRTVNNKLPDTFLEQFDK
ncbi:hypothetical protein IX51_00950 [uncultured archaeon]|nr:hypothetical protein IX51_00950 [uncultured archaeon]